MHVNHWKDYPQRALGEIASKLTEFNSENLHTWIGFIREAIGSLERLSYWASKMDEANGDKNKLTVKINQNRQYSPLSALQSALCVRVLFLISEG